ncbi:MAG TPA: hypothetical protein VJN67_08420 [Stellaceae bacterium]|nr:hypothetical protein [Stellaceae bacterium]
MRQKLNQVEKWRQKAEELHAVADTLRNEVARDQLQQMAEGYTQLADRMEDLVVKQQAERLKR